MQHDTPTDQVPKLTTGERGLAYLADHQGERFTVTTVARAIGVHPLALCRDAKFMARWRQIVPTAVIASTAGEHGIAYLDEHPDDRLTISSVAKAIGVSRRDLHRDGAFMAAWRKRPSAGERGQILLAEHPEAHLTIQAVARAVGADPKSLHRDKVFMGAWKDRLPPEVKRSAKCPLVTFLVSYVDHQPSLKPSSAEQLRCTVKAFERCLERPALVSDLTEDTVLRFISWRLRRVSQEATKRNRAGLLTLWRFASRRKLVAPLPADGIPIIRVARKTPVAWKLGDVEKILETCSTLTGRLFSEADRQRGRRRAENFTGPLQSQFWTSLGLFLFDSGARISAALAVTPADLDLERGVVVLRAAASKTNTEQILNLSPQTIGAIRSIYQSDSPFVWNWIGGKRRLYRAFTEILKRAGLPSTRDFKFHAFRRTCASLVFAAGRADLAQRTLGHTTAAMTVSRYLDPRAMSIESASDALPRPRWTGDTSPPPTSPERPSVAVADVLAELSPDALAALLRLATTLTAAGKTPA